MSVAIAPKLNDAPPRKLHEWCFTWQGEPRKRQPWVSVSVWVPAAVTVLPETAITTSDRIRLLADYLQDQLGWKVSRTSGWSGSRSDGDVLSMASVTVLKSTLPEAP